MKIGNLTDEELQFLREIRIHKILNVKDNGRKITCKCPFHEERTPGNAFWLSPNNCYYCFSCGAKGCGAISFLVGLNNGKFTTEVLENLLEFV